MKKIIYVLFPLCSLFWLGFRMDTPVQKVNGLIQRDTTVVPRTDTLPLPADSVRTDSLLKAGTDSAALAKPATDSLSVVEAISFTGIASFYSSNLDGTKTATGEIFRNSKYTAASNHLKLNTWVRVTNLENNKTVIVRINDRMHPRMKKKGRVVDLSRVAARQLDFMKSGLTKVKVEVVPKGTVE